jgi:SAM-dependent methyltransferase
MKSQFDFEASRRYWRFAPSGVGKHDTSEFVKNDDASLALAWNEAFAARFRQYVEEDEFLRLTAAEFKGKRVLSIGSGLGFHEIYYQSRGAHMTCCDIVPTNLQVIERVAAIKNVHGMQFILRKNPSQNLAGAYDVVFCYGSLMTMPQPLQRELLKQAMTALTADGRIVLMLYTWEFARATCGWSSPAQFDAAVFARASDPSVLEEHCPWSDWHDDAKIAELVGNDLNIRRRQLWNQGWFVWYELAQSARKNGVKPFFDPADMGKDEMKELNLAEFRDIQAANVQHTKTRLVVEATTDGANYLLMTNPSSRSKELDDANVVLVESDLAAGSFSVGVLDDTTNAFVATHAIWELGPTRQIFAVRQLPRTYRIILSNNPTAAVPRARFELQRIAFLRRDYASSALLR